MKGRQTIDTATLVAVLFFLIATMVGLSSLTREIFDSGADASPQSEDSGSKSAER